MAGQAIQKFFMGAGGGGGGKGGGGAASNAPNTLRSTATLKMIDLWGEGEIQGLVNGAKGIILDQTQLQSDDDTYNFKGVVWESRNGLPDQSNVNGFDSVNSQVSVGVQVKQSAPVIRSLTDPGFENASVTVRVPALVHQNAKDGSLGPTSVKFQLEVRYATGPWVIAAGPITITGKCTSPYDAQYYFPLPINPSGDSHPWDVRMTRLTADSTTDSLQNDTYFSSIMGIIPSNFSYPNSAYIAVTIDAEQFGSNIPGRQYLVDGKVLQVPSNYTPRVYDENSIITDDAVYTGIWDGTFKEAWCNNPAWVFYDLLTNDRYGLGSYVDASMIDKWSLYEIAQYCDALVPDGFGGQEPRFTFNGTITSQAEAYECLGTIASSFRGMAYWSAGTIVTSQDSPKDPIILVTPSNVIDGKIDYPGSAMKSRHSVAMVSFLDPDNFYQTGVEVVQNDDAVRRYGYRTTQITATGCTSRGQAHRIGLWTILTELFETSTANYTAGMDHAGVRPGDIVAIQDPVMAGNDFGGRCAADCTLTKIFLDHDVTFATGKTYTMSCILPDGKVGEAPITVDVYNFSTREINLTTPLKLTTDGTDATDPPDFEAIWVISSNTLKPALYRVVSIKEASASTYDVVALQYEPAKFDAVDEGILFEPIPVSELPTGALQPLSNLTYQEYLYTEGGQTKSAVTLSTTPSPDARVSQYQWQYRYIQDIDTLTDWQNIGQTTDSSVDFRDINYGMFDFRVRAISTIGGSTAWLEIDEISLVGIAGLPPACDTFTGSKLGDQFLFSWTVPDATNVFGYEIRFSPLLTNVTWASAVVLKTGITAQVLQVPAISGTYVIKPYNSFGFYSADETQIVLDLGGLTSFNAVDLIDEFATGFAGTKVSLIIDGDGRLRLDKTGGDYDADGMYEFAAPLDLGDVYTSRITALMDIRGVDDRSFMSDWLSLDQVEAIGVDTTSLWQANLFYQITNDDPAGSPTWSDTYNFTAGDVTFRAIRFALHLQSFNTKITPCVHALQVTVDMPDRTIAANDIVVPTAGLRIDFDPPFRHLNGVATLDQNMATGDHKTITSKDETGFFIQYFDSTGTAISRTFDYTAIGYGAVGS